jgi:poly(3-hydroxyalkanoate) synthetase
MADPIAFWRLAWAAALAEGSEHISEAFRGLLPRNVSPPGAVDLSALPTLGRIRMALSTMLLVEERETASVRSPATLVVAPYAIHEASIADFAVGHSLAQALVEGGAGPVALTYWNSATHEMRGYGIDAYLSDLNVAVDDLGGRASLVGLCQGGWLAAAFAARFPAKVAKLVLAGAPIDAAAAPSSITRALAAVTPAAIAGVLAMNGGRVLGAVAFSLWSDSFSPEFTAEAALQRGDDPALVRLFNEWNRRTVDLPGVYFVQTAEWIFRENRLARGAFRALGREALLSAIAAPVFVLAAADDEVVSLPQATAIRTLCPQTPVTVRVERGRHLSLFMGRRTIANAWRDIARWLADADSARPRPGKPARARIARACKLTQDGTKPAV